MKIKVCGLHDKRNIEQLMKLPIDYMGFIFYEPSPRYVLKNTSFAKWKAEVWDAIDWQPTQKRVAVFVNKPVQEVVAILQDMPFDAVQLHGDELPAYCSLIAEQEVEVMKAFGLDENFDMEVLDKYIPHIDYFLFDTQTKHYGGSGQTFNWDMLRAYQQDTPFFLSGGIGLDTAKELQAWHHNNLYGVDINSHFELQPGIKDVKVIQQFITTIM